MRSLALLLLLPAASAFADPIGAHVACFHGKEKQPIQKRKAITKDVACQIVIDQGEPPPSAKATMTLAQDGAASEPSRSSDGFVPQDDGDGIYYPFTESFHPTGDFKACKDFTVSGRIADGDKELWRGAATIQTQCKAAKKLPLVFACHWDGELVCVLQTKNLKTKIPAGAVGRVTIGGTTHAVQDSFADYPDDTRAVEAKFAKGDVPCSGASITATAELPNGQALFAQTIAAPACP